MYLVAALSPALVELMVRSMSTFVVPSNLVGLVPSKIETCLGQVLAGQSDRSRWDCSRSIAMCQRVVCLCGEPLWCWHCKVLVDLCGLSSDLSSARQVDCIQLEIGLWWIQTTTVLVVLCRKLRCCTSLGGNQHEPGNAWWERESVAALGSQVSLSVFLTNDILSPHWCLLQQGSQTPRISDWNSKCSNCEKPDLPSSKS